MRTLGISRKVTEPIKVALVAFVSTWIVTGDIQRELVAGLAVSGIGAVFAYLAPAADVAAEWLDELPDELPEEVLTEVTEGSDVKPDAPPA